MYAGRAKSFPENSAMLAFLYTESKTPIVHVQTMFSDSWRTICKVSEASHAAMTPQERADVRLKAAQRLNLDFLLEWSPYFPSVGEDLTGVPAFACNAELMQPLAKLPPWEAAWNRTVRKIVRLKMRELEGRDEGLKGDTPLSELFYVCTQQAALMNRGHFEQWANQSGLTTSAVSWLSKQMSQVAQVRA